MSAHSRARITAGELVVVYSHYELGVIEEVELFRWVRGDRYDRSADEARAAGWSLAACHRALADFRPLFPAPRRTFHNHPQVPERLGTISGVLEDPGVRGVCRALADAYEK